MKKILLALFIFPVVGFILFFNSCSDFDLTGSSSAKQASTDTDSDDDDDDDDDDDEDDPDDCEESEGDPCEDSEYCKDTCRLIYDGSIVSVNSCKSRGEDTVGVLTEIHDRLMGTRAGRYKDTGFESRTAEQVKDALEKITDDDDDIGPEALKCYLQVGSKKYIELLKDGLGKDVSSETNLLRKDRLIETLKWIVENDSITEVLEDLNAGDDILKTILETLADLYDSTADTDLNKGLHLARCIKEKWYRYKPSETNGPGNSVKDTRTVDQGLWWIDNEGLRFWYYDKIATPPIGRAGKISKSKVDIDLFSSLSCFHHVNNDDDNIFTYSAKESNDYVFETALSFLQESCEDAENTQKTGCARALMCWSSWVKVCYEKKTGAWVEDCNNAQGHTKERFVRELWGKAGDHKEFFENEDGSAYDDCTAKGFEDFKN